MNITEFKKQYPAYEDVDNDKLAGALHQKYYQGKISYPDFRKKIGLSSTPEGETLSDYEDMYLGAPSKEDKAGALTETQYSPDIQMPSGKPSENQVTKKSRLEQTYEQLEQAGPELKKVQSAYEQTAKEANKAAEQVENFKLDKTSQESVDQYNTLANKANQLIDKAKKQEQAYTKQHEEYTDLYRKHKGEKLSYLGSHQDLYKPQVEGGEQPSGAINKLLAPVGLRLGDTSDVARTLEQIGQVYPALEAAAAWTTQPAALVVSGLAGLATAGLGVDQKKTEKMMQAIQQLGYQPMTEKGKDLTETLFLPFEAFSRLGGLAGEKTLEAKESPEWATFVHTLIAGAPAILMGAKTIGKGVGEGVKATKAEIAEGVKAGWNEFLKTDKGKQFEHFRQEQRVKAAEKAGKDLAQTVKENPDLLRAEIERISKQNLGKYAEEMRQSREVWGARAGTDKKAGTGEKAGAPASTESPFNALEQKPEGIKALEEPSKAAPPEYPGEQTPTPPDLTIDQLTEIGRRRMQEATPEMRALRPAEQDWLTESEARQLEGLKQQLPRSGDKQIEAQKRVEQKREQRREQAEKEGQPQRQAEAQTEEVGTATAEAGEAPSAEIMPSELQPSEAEKGTGVEKMANNAQNAWEKMQTAKAESDRGSQLYKILTAKKGDQVLQGRGKIQTLMEDLGYNEIQADSLAAERNPKKLAAPSKEKYKSTKDLYEQKLQDLRDARGEKKQQQAIEQKEPWEMTKEEYYSNERPGGSELVRRFEQATGINAQSAKGKNEIKKYRKHLDDQIANRHKAEIQQAVSEGKPVPEEVLAEYPELQKQTDFDAKVAESQRETAEQRPREEKIGSETEALRQHAGDEGGFGHNLTSWIEDRRESPPLRVLGLKSGRPAAPKSTQTGAPIAVHKKRAQEIADISGNEVVTVSKLDKQDTPQARYFMEAPEGFKNLDRADNTQRTVLEHYLNDTGQAGRQVVESVTKPSKTEGATRKTGDTYWTETPGGYYTPQQQKKFLGEEVTAAIKEAPELEPGHLGMIESAQRQRAEMKGAQEERRGIQESLGDLYGTINIRVPGDGELRIINSKYHLQNFQKKLKSWPTKAPKKPGVPTTKTPPKNQRLISEEGAEVEYYNTFRPRHVDAPIITKDSHYNNGFYTNGAYYVKLSSKPKGKQIDTEGPAMDQLAQKHDRGAVNPAKIVGETTVGSGENELPIAHAQAGGSDFFYDARALDHILTKYPNAQPFASEQGVISFREGGQPVAGIAPLDITSDALSDYQKQRMQEVQAGAEEPAAGGGREASGFEYAKGTYGPKGPETPGRFSNEGNMPAAIDLPEVVDLATELAGGARPAVKRKLGKNVAGWFIPGTGKIELTAQIFQDPELAGKVLAHEIGHLVDWLPDKDLRRGNLLGRVASLKRHMQGKIALDPKSPPASLTEARKQELYEEAQMLAREQAEQLIDKEIRETLPITPEDVLNFWNSLEGEFPVELADYVKRLDTAQKKAIIRDAMKGRVPDELQQFAGTIKTRTVQEPAGGYEEKLKKIYKDLVEEEIAKRKYVHEKTIREELKNWTMKWKPFDPNSVKPAYLKYRFSGKELYADAISGLIVNPGALKRTAPTFYEAFFNCLDRKPAVEKVYAEIQERLSLGPKELARERKEKREAGFRAGSLARRKAIEEARKGGGILESLEVIGTWFDNKSTPLYNRAIRKRERQKDKNGNLTKNAKQAIELRARLEEMDNFSTMAQVYTYDIKQRVLGPLKETGISASELSYFMFQKRVIGERFDIANPGGHYATLSEEELLHIKEDWGPEKAQIIQDLTQVYRQIREDYILPIIEEGGIITPKLMEHIWNTKVYATYDLVKFLEGAVGSGGTAKIYQQFGTLQEVGNLLEATMVKDIQLMRASKVNIIKKQLEEVAPDLLEKAELKYSQDRKARLPVKPKGPGSDILTVFHDGQPTHYYAPKALVETFNTDPARALGLATAMRWLGQPVREIFVSKNPIFMIRNMPRDFRETAMKLPEVQLRNLLELGKLYKEAFPEVVDYIFKGVMSGDIRRMAEHGMIPKSRMWGGTDPTISGEVLDLIEAATLELDKASAGQYHEAQNKLKKVWQGAEMAASTTEIISKVAAYKYLIKHSDKPLSQIGIDVRDKAGTPNFRKRGTLEYITNNLFPFSTVGRNGIKATVATIKDDPKAYAYKSAVLSFIPAMVRWGIRSGLALTILDAFSSDDPDEQFQEKTAHLSEREKQKMKSWAAEMKDQIKRLQRIYLGASEYDMSHYNIIPMYVREDGKSVYLRIPQDYEGQFFSNLASKLMKGEMTGAQGVTGALWEMNPYNLNVFLQEPVTWFNYFALGKTSVDSWTGVPTLDRREQEAGGKYAAKRLAQHSWDNLGGKVIYKPAWGKLETDRGPWEEFLNTMPGKILGTFVKISDRGIAEKIYDEIDKVREQQAIESLEQEQAYIKLMNGELKSFDEVLKILADGPSEQQRKIYELAKKKSGTVFEKALTNANTRLERAAVFKVMLEENFIRTPYESSNP